MICVSILPVFVKGRVLSMVESGKVMRKLLIPVALLINNKQRHQPIKGVKKYYYLTKGFMNESMILYGLTSKNYTHYLSDSQILKTGTINQDGAYYLNNKVVFVDMLEGRIGLPKTFATINEGKISTRTTLFHDTESLFEYLEENPDLKLVIKPIAGAEGRGVGLISWNNGAIKRNSQHMTLQAFREYISGLDNYFISEFIQQGQFANKLFSDSLNTIRILTMIDPQTDKAFVAAAVFRVGTRLSAPTDNFRRRGLSVAIDLETGQLGKAAMIPHEGIVNWFERHPNTGKLLTGQQVPHWPDIQTNLLDVANYINQRHQIKYVGWDVVVTDQGIQLLEGNSRPGVSLHQVHQPLLVNPKVKAFYRHHQVLN